MKKVLVLAMMLLAGCSAQKSQVMSSTGKVILIRGCEVCVSYDIVDSAKEDALREKNGVDPCDSPLADKSLGCFAHLNGHRYQVGDTYPDQAKHSTGAPVNCEQGDDWNPAPIESLLSDGGGFFGGRKMPNNHQTHPTQLQRQNGIGMETEHYELSNRLIG